MDDAATLWVRATKQTPNPERAAFSMFDDFSSWPGWAKASVILLSIIAFCSTFRLTLELVG